MYDDDNDEQSEDRRERITFSGKNPKRDVYREADLRARALMSANSNLSYGDALHAVYRADEDLHRECLKTPPRKFTSN